jgi:hypothetical protein
VLDKYTEERVEAQLTDLKATGEKIPQGMLLYDVHFGPVTHVDYKDEPLMRTGIAILDD